ncbi:hypothetical protein BaRGS_00037824 [Batillaria attramentaria]|uniref:Uncharacterized protein n=1 Tax=Batillaria attramentaria TaxID=370345 RepID=A0ABD0J7N4_9CAEN
MIPENVNASEANVCPHAMQGIQETRMKANEQATMKVSKNNIRKGERKYNPSSLALHAFLSKKKLSLQPHTFPPPPSVLLTHTVLFTHWVLLVQLTPALSSKEKTKTTNP